MTQLQGWLVVMWLAIISFQLAAGFIQRANRP